jgi:hypothetical protein
MGGESLLYRLLGSHSIWATLYQQLSNPTYISARMKSGRFVVQSEYNILWQISIDFLASITVSPVSTAAQGLVSVSKGLSLRFPRFIRVREDKAIENASTSEFLAGLWRSQQKKGDGAFADDLIDVDIEEDLGLDDYDDEEEE